MDNTSIDTFQWVILAGVGEDSNYVRP
jgi:hypothetical protein